MFRLNLTLSFHFHNDLLSMIKMFFVCLFLVLVQYGGLIICNTLYYIFIALWLKFNYINVILTCPIN